MAISGRYAWILRGNILFLLLFFVSSQGLEEGDPCNVGTHKGKCTLHTQCTTLAEAIRRKIVTKSTIPKCGLAVFGEIICCPILDLPIRTTTVSSVIPSSTIANIPDEPEKTLNATIDEIFGTGLFTANSGDTNSEGANPNSNPFLIPSSHLTTSTTIAPEGANPNSNPFLIPSSHLTTSTTIAPELENILQDIFNPSNGGSNGTPRDPTETIQNQNIENIFGPVLTTTMKPLRIAGKDIDPSAAFIDLNDFMQSKDEEEGVRTVNGGSPSVGLTPNWPDRGTPGFGSPANQIGQFDGVNSMANYHLDRRNTGRNFQVPLVANNHPVRGNFGRKMQTLPVVNTHQGRGNAERNFLDNNQVPPEGNKHPGRGNSGQNFQTASVVNSHPGRRNAELTFQGSDQAPPPSNNHPGRGNSGNFQAPSIFISHPGRRNAEINYESSNQVPHVSYNHPGRGHGVNNENHGFAFLSNQFDHFVEYDQIGRDHPGRGRGHGKNKFGNNQGSNFQFQSPPGRGLGRLKHQGIAFPTNQQAEFSGNNFAQIQPTVPGRVENFGATDFISRPTQMGQNMFSSVLNQGLQMQQNRPLTFTSSDRHQNIQFPSNSPQFLPDHNKNNNQHLDKNDVVWNRPGDDNRGPGSSTDIPLIRPSTYEPHFQTERPAAKACEFFKKKFTLPLTSHILGGTPAEEGEFPYMAAIGYTDIGESNVNWKCGGSLIDPRFVLTAAHCVYDPNSQPTVVRLGAINLKTPSNYQDIDIKVVHVHPNYSSFANYDDIAILELTRPPLLNNYVQPICLVEDVRTISPELKIYVAGYGQVSMSTGNMSDVLLKADLELEDQSVCSRTYKSEHDASLQFRLSRGIQDSQICAVDRSFKKDSCRGDSGGPLSVLIDENRNLYSLIGVISTGFICGSAAPGIYTRVSYYLDYIENIVWKNL